MATNIEMNIMQSNGQYETVYPQTTTENVIGLNTELSNLENQFTQSLTNYFTKTQTLQSSTATAFGLDTGAVPDDVLLLIANNLYNGLGNQYVWEKSVYVEKLDSLTEKTQLFTYSSGSPGIVEYGTEITISVEGTVSLKNSTTVKVGYVADGAIELSDFRSLIPGKYAVCSGVLYKFDSDVSISGSGTSTRRVFVDSGGSKVDSELQIVEYVNSDSSNAYPPSDSDGYTYTLLGKLGEKVRIEMGSYVGTGTYGSSNPNMLTFGFKPKVVLVFGVENGWSTPAFFVHGFTQYYVNYSGGGYYDGVFSLSGSTVSWYDTDPEEEGQLNGSGKTYTYIAIG